MAEQPKNFWPLVRREIEWWSHEYPKTFVKFRERWCRTLTLDAMRLSSRASSKNLLEKKLNFGHLFFISLSQYIGAGIFVIIGGAAVGDSGSGPSISVAVLIAGILSCLSILTYAELCSNYPVAGAGFNYTLAIFGELPAWIVGFSSTVGHVFVGGVLARSWSTQLARVCGQDHFIVRVGSANLDFVAFGIVIVLILPVALRTLYTSWINIVIKSVVLVIITIILSKLFPAADLDNWEGPHFFLNGSSGIFSAAFTMYFAFSGGDAACYMAEEAEEPVEYIVPAAIVDCFIFVAVIYILMALSLSLTVPLDQANIADVGSFLSSPFRYALKSIGEDSIATLATYGALFAIGTVLLSQLMVTTRLFLAMARYHYLPSWLAYVDERTSTPWVLTLIFGFARALAALFVDPKDSERIRIAVLLLELSVVASAFVWRRYYSPGPVDSLSIKNWQSPGIRLILIAILSFSFGAAYHYEARSWVLFTLLGLLFATAVSFYILPQEKLERKFEVHFAPLVGSGVVLGSSFLLWQDGSEKSTAVITLGSVVVVSLVLYVVYGVHAASRHDEAVQFYLQLLRAGRIDNLPFEEGQRYQRFLDENDRLVLQLSERGN